MARCAVRAVIFSLVCTAGLRETNPSAQFRSAADTVAVYATVSDANGRLVPNLTREDFAVLDNGRPVQVSLFSNDRQPITVAIMLDMSGSMVRRFLKVRESTRGFVNALRPEDRAQIGSFGEEVAVSPLLTNDKSVLARVLDQELWPLGPTPLWNAADAAMTALAGQSGRRVVLMLTDGRDSCNFPRCRDFDDVEERAKREDFMFYAIAMDDRGLSEEIVELARQTGGGHFELTPDENLDETFARVAEELRHQYLIGFSPSVLDGKEHRLDVRLTRGNLRARARTSYRAARTRPGGFAPPAPPTPPQRAQNARGGPRPASLAGTPASRSAPPGRAFGSG